MQGTQVNQHIDERILVGDSLPIAQLGPLDAQGHGLGVDPLGSGALLVGLALAIELMPTIVSYLRVY
jgi:hypothetical protein